MENQLPKSRGRRVAFKVFTIAFGVIGLLAFLKYRSISKAIAEASKFAPPPDAVTTVVAKVEQWYPTVPLVASLEASEGALLSADEAGRVAEVLVQSGAEIKQGDLLLRLDTAVEEGRLKSVQAHLELARLHVKRAEELRAQKAMSVAALDNAIAEVKQAEGELAATKAQIQRKQVVAPFSGRSGIRAVNVGQFVSPGTPLIPLYRMDPLYVNFSIPQQQLPLVAPGKEVTLHVDVYPDRKFSARISAVNPNVDETTRNTRVQATVANADGALRPGMFVEVTLTEPNPLEVVPLPATAVSYASYGNSIYIVEQMKDPAGKEYHGVRQQFVKIASRRGDLVGVTGGVKPGEQVVTSGVFKLRPGGPVTINNDVQPANSPNPSPSDT